jgi:DNA-directed RNA polymerase subunit RPC12/RpoP
MPNNIFEQRISEMGKQLSGLLASPVLRFSESESGAIPEAPGIYIIFEDQKLVYLGSAQNLNLRLWHEHYLGEQVRMGGSQLRHVLSVVNLKLVNNEVITEYIKDRCSFAFIKWDQINKRDLKFIEDFFSSVLRPDYIKFGALDKVWEAQKKSEHNKQIVYKCEDCGIEFISHRARTIKLCSDCAGKRRREGRGSVQLKRKSNR